MNNLTASCFSVLINGESAGFFQTSWGLKQGDPLSPYLFLFIVKALGRGLHHLLHTGQLAPFSLPRGATPISRLSFADDLVIFTRATGKSLSVLMDFLGLYESATGQLVNKLKSSFVVSKHCTAARRRMISHMTGISSADLPMKYLGCMLHKGRGRRVYFQHIVDKINSALTGWSWKLLSQGGRLCLIKHVLSWQFFSLK